MTKERSRNGDRIGDEDLIGTSWLHCNNGKRYVVVAPATNPNTGEAIVCYCAPDGSYHWRRRTEFLKKFRREPGFKNHSQKRLWSETECRTMLNAALLYLAHQAGGTMSIPVPAMLAASEHMVSVSMALTDDDSTLIIGGMRRT